MKRIHIFSKILIVLIAFSGFVLIATECKAVEKTFIFNYEVEVPARGITGAPPKRESEFSLRIPSAFELTRASENQGTSVVHVNFGGLKELKREFKSIENGVAFKWVLENRDSFPITGRKASISIQLSGKRIAAMKFAEKYKKIRKRFFDNFYIQGRIAESILFSTDSNKIKFADQTIYMGQALMMLSTEMKINKYTGEDSFETKGKIKEILTAIEELDHAANQRYGLPPEAELNGLIVRDDITGNKDSRLGGYYQIVESDWQNPEKEMASPSGDQIFGLMYGLLAVVSFSEDNELSQRAANISSRLYEFSRKNNFVLKLPNGQATRRGSDMRWLSSLLHGLNKSITGEDLFHKSNIEVAGIRLPLNGVAAFWDDRKTAKKIEMMTGVELTVPIVNKKYSLNSFALHILLMAIAPSDIWSQTELERIAVKSNHHLSILLYNILHSGTLPVLIDENSILDILEKCPIVGPQQGLPADTGWQRDNRWIRCTNIYNPNNGSKKYNGIDWLILHNLWQLVF